MCGNGRAVLSCWNVGTLANPTESTSFRNASSVLGAHSSTTGPRPVILIVDRFLLLRRERGAPGHADDQQDREQRLFHVNLHSIVKELAFGAWQGHGMHNA